MSIDVAFTRAEVRPAETAVVIDVLRASTTITHALSCGYRRVLVVDDVDAAAALSAPGRVLAGERSCERPPGFDLGNSPQGTDPPLGEELVLATTNGAPAIVAAAHEADDVLVGCLLNLEAVCAAIGERDVLLLCAGTDGRAGIDDVYVAGRISASLAGPRSDAALIAERVAGAHPEALPAIGAGTAASNLREVGLQEDIAFCAQESITSLVPRLTASSAGIAILRAESPCIEDELWVSRNTVLDTIR
ncbi:MAG: 2-phosphosulfolactate phosphatase [Solirubrobacterales bacterium]|nr:2-phosphosulfolactate phosphatase [Solirubrobacterales bacterium]